MTRKPRGDISAVLVGRAQLGDRAALEAILTAVRAPLFAHIRGILGDGDMAEDVLQETLLTICRKLGTVREPQWFRAWAYRVATREAVRQGRRERFWINAEREELERVVATDPDELFEPELLELLRKELPKLPVASQLVLRMHYLDELTYVEIAEALEIPVGTVKSRVAYGLASLRQRVALRRGLATGESISAEDILERHQAEENPAVRTTYDR